MLIVEGLPSILTYLTFALFNPQTAAYFALSLPKLAKADMMVGNILPSVTENVNQVDHFSVYAKDSCTI